MVSPSVLSIPAREEGRREGGRGVRKEGGRERGRVGGEELRKQGGTYCMQTVRPKSMEGNTTNLNIFLFHRKCKKSCSSGTQTHKILLARQMLYY